MGGKHLPPIRCIEIKNRRQAEQELTAIGCDHWGIKHMAGKAVFKILKLNNITPTQANIIKQEILSLGGEAAVTRGTVNHSVPKTAMLLMATENQYQQLGQKLKIQPFQLKTLVQAIEKTMAILQPQAPRTMNCRGLNIKLGQRTLVMGILNVTPDSFSDGGQFASVNQALQHARQMVADGADIIDVGGESTRPGHQAIPAEQEISRVIPVIEKLATELTVPLAVDTSKAQVAKLALQAGAHIVNDVWAGQADVDMFQVVADFQAPVILMHNQHHHQYSDLMTDITGYLQQTAAMAIATGVAPAKIIIDPGIGFGKNLEQNIAVMKRLGEFQSLGYPVLLGTSRKAMIGKTLNLPVNQRVEGTAATVTYGITKGVEIVRVHDVKAIARVCRMTDALVREECSHE